MASKNWSGKMVLRAGGFGLAVMVLAGCVDESPTPPSSAVVRHQAESDPSAIPPGVLAWVDTNRERLQVDRIEPSPIEGLYTVWNGLDAILVPASGDFYIVGDVVRTAGDQNVFETTRQQYRIAQMQLARSSVIRFAPENPRHEIFVFTDTDCGYCRMLHAHMSEYNALGIAVNYLPWPRAGEGSKTWDTMEDVWCASDPAAALTSVKTGGTVEDASCEHPLDAALALGQRLQIRGTPALVFEDGRLFPGYAPPEQLLAALNETGATVQNP